ncbi:MAG TPA: hypothetical protein VLY45_01525 [Nitrospiria bacterium]|nr:hypothetical protein [Nitrospiria bacterium]
MTAAGCAGFDVISHGPFHASESGTPPSAQERVEVASLLEYARGLEVLNEAALQEEFTRAQQAVTERHQPGDRIRLALLLGDPRAPFKDYDRSLALLDEVVADQTGQDDASRALAGFLSSMVREFKKQGDQYLKLDAKYKEEKKQRELLQQKLDELTTIEQKLLEQGTKKSP